MLGTLDSTKKDVTVVGAGIAGLLAAHYLQKKGYIVTLLEAESRAGGLINTLQTPFGISETGAHSVLATAAVQDLAEELGTELAPVRKNSRARFILREGKLRKFPLKAGEALSAFLRAYFVLSDRRQNAERMALDQWAARFFGKGAMQYLFTPFVRGIYGAEPADITVGAAFPSLIIPPGHSPMSLLLAKALRLPFKRKRAPGGLAKKRKKQMMAPVHGMGTLVESLEKRLESVLGDRFRKNHAVETLPSAGNLILAVPAHAAAGLLEREDPRLSEALRSVPYTPMVSVTVFVDRQSFSREIRGVGVLAPALEGRDVLGILFNSSSFPNRVCDESGFASFTVMMGGSAHPEWLDANDERIQGIVTQELRELLGVTKPPTHMVIQRWRRAIPQYGLALQDCWEAARAGWCSQPGRILFGNYTGQVSLRGMIEDAANL